MSEAGLSYETSVEIPLNMTLSFMSIYPSTVVWLIVLLSLTTKAARKRLLVHILCLLKQWSYLARKIGLENSIAISHTIISYIVAGKTVDDCTVCDAGMYCAGTNLTAPSGICGEGYYCPSDAAIRSPQPTNYQCPKGYFCLNETADPEPCPPGEHSDWLVCWWQIDQSLFILFKGVCVQQIFQDLKWVLMSPENTFRNEFTLHCTSCQHLVNSLVSFGSLYIQSLWVKFSYNDITLALKFNLFYIFVIRILPATRRNHILCPVSSWILLSDKFIGAWDMSRTQILS